MPSSTIGRRIGPSGHWDRLLPGVVVTHRGTPTWRERALGALKFGGPGSALTGASALRMHGVQAGRADTVHIAVPHSRQRASFGYVTVSRSRRLGPITHLRGLPCVPVARATVDYARACGRLDEVREIVAAVVQRGLCTVADLREEVCAAARQRTALARKVLAEVSAGVRAVSEAKLQSLLAGAGIPEPLWNAELRAGDGTLLAIVDAIWAEVMAVIELDSMEWHLSPGAYKHTQRRQRMLTSYGVIVMPIAPGDVLERPEAVLAEVRQLLVIAAARPAPHLLVSRAAA